MQRFLDYLREDEERKEGKLLHITHAEDHPLLSGEKGFHKTMGVLLHAHNHIKAKHNNDTLTMKHDGSPAVVYGHHPENGKFFVATKSAWNSKPKLNYSHADVEKHHGHSPGLVKKLKDALDHIPKIAPKKGVYQGDLLYSHEDKHEHA